MAFYGNIIDSSHIHFQFDKIFSSRTEMDRACRSGVDGIYAGRFVLVKYDTENRMFQGDVLYGYWHNNILYQDTAYTKPYIFTTFTVVEDQDKTAEDWDLYYDKIEQGNFYFKLPDASYYKENKTYYTADARTENNIELLVSENTIVRLRDINAVGQLTNTFLQCTGTISGEPASWIEITESQHYQDYFTNFELDARTYGEDFNNRGYDATVWQKIYGEGSGRFILIAHLNSASPSFEFIQDPPSMQPLSASIDPSSTEDVYKIHVPTHWGFAIKETIDPMKSDAEQRNTDLDIYLNLGKNSNLGSTLYHVNESHVDTDTENTISITPTGYSGTLYEGEQKIDTQELSINLPIIGNMIDKGYDLIYGPGREFNNSETLIRARDINWYEADEDALKANGRIELGGKTYDLTSFAGILNTMHTQLGQIIKTLHTRPDVNTIPQYSENYIYYIEDEDKYYRIGPSHQYTLLTNADYNFVPISYDPITYITDTYYYQDNNNNYIISQGIPDPNNPPTLYQKSVRGEMYHEVTNLISYYPATYYVQQGVDYFRDNANQPSYSFYPDGTYYNITRTTSFSGIVFDGEYAASTYYYLENGNYIRDESDTATADRQYYQNFDGVRYNDALIYIKNKFYYLNPITGAYSICAYDTVGEAQSALGNDTGLYWLEFDETQEIVVSYENNGVIETFIGHPLKDAHPLKDKNGELIPLSGMRNPPNNIANFYCEINNDYIAYLNLNYNTKDENGVPFYATVNNYIELNVSEITPVTNLYVTGKYYYIDDAGNYLKAYTNLNRNITYYLIDTIVPLEQPFYIPNKYYYESSTNYFEIDISSSMTPGRRYYNAEKLYVVSDYTGRCPYGYEWSNYSVFVPASVTLGHREDGRQFIEIVNFMKDGVSINADLLQLEKYLETDNRDTRDKNTVRGVINQLQDKLFVLDRLVPRQVLFVNDFGQITSSNINYSDLLDIINKHDEIMNL